MSTFTIVEVLDFGYSLLDSGDVVKKDGTIISKEKYAELQELQVRNKLDWTSIEGDEFFALLESSIFATKTYAEEIEIGGIPQSKFGFAIIDSEGTPYYLRSNEFSGSETFEIAETDFSRLIYNVDKNSSETAFDTLVERVEELFDTTHQVGSEFSPDSENTYLIKKFVKDNHIWSLVFKNGKLSNIKEGEKLHIDGEVKSKTSKVASRLNNMNLA